jgi:NADH-quinone oxidoreductase subunit N
VNLSELYQKLLVDTTGSSTPGVFAPDGSLSVFLPETVLCGTILLMLLVRTTKIGGKADGFYFALFGGLLALYFAAPWKHLTGAASLTEPASAASMSIFSGMLVYDTFTVYMRSILIGFLVLFALFTKLSGIPRRDDGADVYALIIGATIGMCLMSSANHLLMVFIAIEMASVPSYALAGLLKAKRTASEAALKYAIYGAGAAGVMLYGISLIGGLLNTVNLPEMAAALADKLPSMNPSEQMVLAFGGLMVAVGLAFKLSAFPFHFWAPDVFEGATAEVGAFLSIASKAAALALLLRVVVSFSSVSEPLLAPGVRTAAAESAASGTGNEQAIKTNESPNFVSTQRHSDSAPMKQATGEPWSPPATGEPWSPETIAQKAAINGSLSGVRDFIGKLIAFFAILTCTFGNLAAYGQTNIKRLLAYSTIAHAGYMMMAAAALVSVSGVDPAAAQNAVAGLAIYIFTYLFMNLGAFAIAAFLRNKIQSEEISDYGGLIKQSPILVLCFCAILFSLVGLPPLAGFIGKFAIFASLAECYGITASAGAPANYLLWTLVAGGLNTAVSLFYYLRVIRVMTMSPEPANRPPYAFSDVSIQGAFVWALTLPTLALILNWDGVAKWAEVAASSFAR